MRCIVVLAVSALSLSSCDKLPRDPERTSERIEKDRRVRVGLTEHAPWVIRTSTGEPAGAEVELVRRLARELGAVPDWYWNSDTQHMHALKTYELDLVIAGLDSKTPWSKEVGFIRPFYEESIVVGVPPSASQPDRLDGFTVAVRRGDPVASKLVGKHANANRVPALDGNTGALAAPDWFVEQIGYSRTKFTLETRKYVMAVPPGENGWILRLETFLAAHRNEIKSALQAAAGGRLQ